VAADVKLKLKPFKSRSSRRRRRRRRRENRSGLPPS
jgi:hypothetical protein